MVTARPRSRKIRPFEFLPSSGGFFIARLNCQYRPQLLWWCSEAATSCTRPPASPGNMDIIARKDALAQGLTHYFTGKPCKHGHVSARYSKTGQCVECLYLRSCREEIKQKVAIRTKTDSYKARRRVYHRNYYRSKNPARRIFHKNKTHAKIASNIRTRINMALKNKYKHSSTAELLGCTISELVSYLELRFIDGMTWENHGIHGWHIDHIRPCASFDLTDPEQQRQCFHYTNLQPLWAGDNLSKGSVFDPTS